MELTNIKRLSNGTCLKATFKIVWPEFNGLFMWAKYFEKGDASWITFPSQEYKDKEGKTKYFTMAGWPDDIKKEYERKAKELLNAPIPEEELPF